MKNLLSILKMDFAKTNRIGKNLRSLSCFVCCLILVLGSSFQSLAAISSSSNAFAVNPNYLIGSASNADPYGIATMELTDEDYDIQPFSSLGSVNNTVNWDSNCLDILVYDESAGGYISVKPDSFSYSTSGGIDFSTILESDQHLFYIDYVINRVPSPGVYSFSFDFGSDFSVDYTTVQFISRKNSASVQTVESGIYANVVENSGDFYFAPSVLEVGNCSEIIIRARLTDSLNPLSGIHSYGGTFKASFVRSDGDPVFSTVDPEYGSMDYETDVSGSLSDISSSIGDMSSSMDSASESLEYISTSQNLIIQGIDNVIMHISDQLYAFWDQLYNLIHEPTYARLGDILDALKAIANNSDIYAVVETIEESSEKQTADIIANNNANTSKVESAVEKHGNFIIDGLKGLFIPSDEYFKTYFDDLYSYFSDRFGFLSFPIDLLVRLIDLFVNSSDRDCILTLPAFEISGEQLISEASFNLTEFLENDFSLVLSSIRMVTSIGLIMAFVSLCQTKWNEVMRN